jgi:hypothetical protein
MGTRPDAVANASTLLVTSTAAINLQYNTPSACVNIAEIVISCSVTRPRLMDSWATPGRSRCHRAYQVVLAGEGALTTVLAVARFPAVHWPVPAVGDHAGRPFSSHTASARS